MRWKTLPVITFLVLICIGSSGSAEERLAPDLRLVSNTPDLLQAEDLDSVRLDRTVYFLKPDGSYAVAAPGLYLLRAREDTHLLLIPGQGKEALLVQAQGRQHQDQISEPVALSIPDKESGLHLVLLLPDSKSLDARGAFNPVRLRGLSAETLPPEQVRQALERKKAALVPQ